MPRSLHREQRPDGLREHGGQPGVIVAALTAALRRLTAQQIAEAAAATGDAQVVSNLSEAASKAAGLLVEREREEKYRANLASQRAYHELKEQRDDDDEEPSEWMRGRD